MQASLILLGLLALTAPLVQGAAVACKAGQFQCRDGSCTNSLADKCDGVKTCKDGSDEDPKICDALPSSPFKLDDAEHATVARITYSAEHKGIVLMACNILNCTKMEITGSNKDGAMSYTFYEDCNTLGGGPTCKLNRTVSAPGATPLSAGPVVLNVLRLPMRLAVFLEGHMSKALLLGAPLCADKLKVKPLHWTSDMPVAFTKKKVEQFEKEGQAGQIEVISGAQVIADTLIEAMSCALAGAL